MAGRKESLVHRGVGRIEWARAHMPVLAEIRARLKEDRPFEGLTVGMALHTEAKTAVLALTIREGGAKVALTSCNPLSTDDAVAAALRRKFRLETFAKRGQSTKEYYAGLNAVLDRRPDLLVDDGADLIFLTHTKRRELLSKIRGANEETTTGVTRLRAMAEQGELRFPVMAVNDAHMKYLFDNRYGTGQSTLDGLMTATNLLLAGARFVVAGYGWCGRGIALRARGMGAHVVVTEVDPIRAIEAKLDGFEVLPMRQAAREARFIVTATGCKDVVTAEDLKAAADGCVLANAGHFDNEISKADLERLARRKRRIREHVEEYELRGGKRLYLLSEGRLVNLAAGQGHPVEIMDLSFAIQALCLEHLVLAGEGLEPDVYDVPKHLDEAVARLELASMGVRLDRLTKEQRRYLTSWKEGT